MPVTLSFSPLNPRWGTRSRLVLATLVLTIAAFSETAAAAENRWSSAGPYGAEIKSVAVDPTAPATVYAGTRGGNIYTSTDSGDTWRHLLSVAGQVEALVLDPSAPSTLYAAARRIYKTTDGGARWVDLGQAADFLIADPRDPSILYAGSRDSGIAKTTDGGQTWTAINNGLAELRVQCLGIAASDPDVLYAGTLSSLYKTVDGGANWVYVSAFPDESSDLRAVVIDPSTVATVYVAARGGVFKTTDDGATWQEMNLGLPLFPITLFLALDPSVPSTLYLRVVGDLYKTTDGGGQWELLADFSVQDLAFDPSAGSTLYAAGSTMRRSRDGGVTWQEIERGLQEIYILSLAPDPSTPDTVYAASLDQEIFLTTDGGDSWQNLRGVAGELVVVDPAAPLTLYVSSGLFLQKTTDGGATWETVLALPRPLESVAVDPSTVPSTVYVGTGRGGLIRSFDGGLSWELVLDELFPITAIAVDTSTVPSTLYAGVSGFGIEEARIWRSNDGGYLWDVVFTSSAYMDVTGGGYVDDLVIDPAAPATVYAAISGEGVLKTTNGGATWNPAGRGLPDSFVSTLVIDSGRPSILYAGFDDNSGVYRSIDGGASWFPLPGGLGAHVFDLALDPRGTLLAGADGGVYEIDPVTAPVFQDGRFRVEVEWRDAANFRGLGTVALVPPSAATTAPLRSRDSAVVEFFGAENWELLVKVLDGRALNDHFWVFFAAATNVGYDVTVTDTGCGVTRTYSNALGAAAPAVTDVEAFVPCASPAPPSCTADSTVSPPLKSPRGDTVCLGPGGRFAVEVTWQDFTANSGPGRLVRLADSELAVSNDSGLFFFFNESNWELLVKVLDGCDVNGSFWVFSAATTDAEYTLRVTDTLNGEVREYFNPLGTAASATTDVGAFSGCP